MKIKKMLMLVLVLAAISTACTKVNAKDVTATKDITATFQVAANPIQDCQGYQWYYSIYNRDNKPIYVSRALAAGLYNITVNLYKPSDPKKVADHIYFYYTTDAFKYHTYPNCPVAIPHNGDLIYLHGTPEKGLFGRYIYYPNNVHH